MIALRHGLIPIVAVAAAVAAAGAMHRYDTARCQRTVARMEADAARALLRETEKVLALERARREQERALEDLYAHLVDIRAAAAAETARLSGELGAALERLRQRPADSGGHGVSSTPPSSGGCEDIRAALDRALGAVAILAEAGDRIALDGQHAVDVATIAARAASHDIRGKK